MQPPGDGYTIVCATSIEGPDDRKVKTLIPDTGDSVGARLQGTQSRAAMKAPFQGGAAHLGVQRDCVEAREGLIRVESAIAVERSDDTCQSMHLYVVALEKTAAMRLRSLLLDMLHPGNSETRSTSECHSMYHKFDNSTKNESCGKGWAGVRSEGEYLWWNL